MTVLETFKQLSGAIHLDGALRKSAATEGFDGIDPATEEVTGELAYARVEEVDEAVEVARRAQREWNRMNMLKRSELLHEVAHKFRHNVGKLAEALTREMGKPYKESADEVEWTATAFDYYAEIARHENGRVVGPVVDGQFHVVTKHPLGVVGIILPFNFPYVLFGWEAGAALGAGNAVILKPSELTSFSSLMMMECFDHLPRGLVQCITGAAEVGKRLVGHEGVDGVAFTGSVPAGQAVAQTCATTFKRCLVEASGNDPFIVMPSAKLDMAAQGAVFSAYLNCGQVCAAAERFYIHADVHDAFVEETVKLIGKDVAEKVRDISIRLYKEASDYAAQKGIIIADTKFEFGTDAKGNLVLIDEALTADSSRFWPADSYQVGISPPSFDKQYVRDYLETLDWDKTPPAPKLPPEVIAKTSQKYREALERLTGRKLA